MPFDQQTWNHEENSYETATQETLRAFTNVLRKLYVEFTKTFWKADSNFTRAL